MKGAELKRVRVEMGHTQESLAAHFGCSISSIRNWEQERRRIPEWVQRSVELTEANRALSLAVKRKKKRRT